MRLFISYSRDDKAWVYELWRALRDRAFHDAWIDQRVVPAQDWWDTILTHIEQAESIVYVMTPKSVESIYCLAEVLYAVELNKPLVPLMLKDCAYPAELTRRRIQYEMIHDDTTLGDVLFVIERALSEIRVGHLQGKYAPPEPPPARPDEPRPARKPEQVSEVFMLAEEAASANNTSLAEKLFQQVIEADPKGYGLAAVERLGDIRAEREQQADYLNVAQMAANPARRVAPPTLWWRTPTLVVAAAFILIFGAVGVTLLLADVLSGGGEPTAPATSSTQAGESGVAAVPSETSMPEPGRTLDIAELVQTLDAGATLQQTTRDAQALAAERATEYAVATQQKADETATATLWTAIPTPNMTASVEAYLTERAAITQTWIDSWTDTPTFTPTATPDLLQEVLARAETFGGGNDNWEPVVQEFNGIEMVLVPAGCFMMGSEEGSSDEQPVHEVCVDAFWLGKTEVTNSQYRACVDAGDCSPPADPRYFDSPDYADHPIVYVSWTQAVAYAAWVGGALPTEAQWEYAARGPENWKYPWGEAFDCRLANITGSECDGYDRTAPAGSFPSGASWAGALDMSGNVWEWTSTAYREYPYHADDGREDAADTTARRVLRGGSWFNDQDFAPAAFRGWNSPLYRNSNFGFRVVRVPHL